MRRTPFIFVLLALPALSAGTQVPREPFANAHVTLMARSQVGDSDARLADMDVWAEGTRLRARLRGEPAAGEFWVDGLSSQALRIVDSKVVQSRKRTMEYALELSLSASPTLANANTDRIAGHPCKIVTEDVPGGVLTRCIWRGLPLSVELKTGTFTFNAAATMVEENVVRVADIQPPPGAPAAPPSMSAGN